MTCPRTVTLEEPTSSDVKSKLKFLTTLIPAVVSMAPNTVSADTVLKDLDSLARNSSTEDVLPHFRAALAAAVEQVEALPEETKALERQEVLVNYLRHHFDEADLTSQLERASEAASSDESWLSTLSQWAIAGLNKALCRGTEVASGAHRLLPFVSLLGMVGALPVASQTDEEADEASLGMIDHVTDGAEIEGTKESGELDGWLKIDWSLAGMMAVWNLITLMGYFRGWRMQRRIAARKREDSAADGTPS